MAGKIKISSRKDEFLIIGDGNNPFINGWRAKEDQSKMPLGSAQESYNIQITDRGGIAPRGGELLLGTYNTGQYGTTGLYSFKKFSGPDILVKPWGARLEYFNNKSQDWCLLYDGYALNAKFGFKECQNLNDYWDYLYFCNAVDPYSRWNGYEAITTGALVGGETSVPVDTVFTSEIINSGTASAVTPTTLTISPGTWGTDIYNGFYVRITSGANAGKIGLISATTTTQITFGAIAGLAGTPTFEIRRLAVPTTGTLVYNNSKVAYTAIPTDSSFTVAAAVAAPSGTGLTVAPETFPTDPRGNILETRFQAMYVAGKPGFLQSAYRSHIADATDFTFASPRAADEGDVQMFPYNGKFISDIKSQESSLYVFKPDSIESWVYTQDVSDLSQITPIIQGTNVGTKAKAWKMGNDIAFVTPDKKISTIGRIISKDQIPQTADIADPIVRKMQVFEVDSVVGETLSTLTCVALKSSPTAVANDIVLARRDTETYQCWQGIWQVSASALVAHNSKLYYGDSFTPNVYQLQTGLNKIRGTDVFPISARWKSSFINLRNTGFYIEEVSSLAVEGYITSGTTITFDLFKDFAPLSFQTLQLSGLEIQYQDNADPIFSFLGGDPLGLQPLGAGTVIGDPDDQGRRHFIVFLDFQMVQAEYIAIQVSSSALNQNWEILALGLNATQSLFENQNRIKN